jgi:hypothetical protein
MELTEEDITSFIAMWKEEFGDTLARDIARQEARRLLDFFAALSIAEAESRGQSPPHHGTMGP